MFKYIVRTPVGRKTVISCFRPTCHCLERLNYPMITIHDYEVYEKCRERFRFPEAATRTKPLVRRHWPSIPYTIES